MRLNFPTRSYAEAAMNTIQVDPPFSETKTKKASINREMRVVDDDSTGLSTLEVQFSCDESEVGFLRTAVSSFITNMSLVCNTMKEFGN